MRRLISRMLIWAAWTFFPPPRKSGDSWYYKLRLWAFNIEHKL